MKVYKDGAQIVVEEDPKYPGEIFNINSAWSCMEQAGAEVIVMNARSGIGHGELLANVTDSGGTPLTISDLRAIIGS